MPRPDAQKFRMRHRQRGERYRWLKAYQVPEGTAGRESNGYLYVEQTLNSAVRCLVDNTTVEMQGADFGIYPQGSTSISVMPDESFLAHNDRIVLSDRRMLTREQVTRGAGATDTLMHPYIASVSEVRRGTTAYVATTNYTVAGNVITWVAGGPSAGQEYLVEYSVSPLFEFIPVLSRLPRPSKDTTLMPQRGVLRLVTPQ